MFLLLINGPKGGAVLSPNMSSRKKQGDDERFCRVQKDPRFWEMPEKERKVKIDKRFQSMFHDRRFQTKQTVDKRGRPVQLSTAADLRRFYQLEEEDEEEGEEEEEDEEDEEEEDKQEEDEEEDKQEEEVPVQGQKKQRLGRGSRAAEKDDEEVEHQSGDDDDDDDDESGLDSEDDSGPDLARGKGNMETSSDEDEDDDDVDDILRKEEEQIEHDWGELCRDAPRSEQVSARLAVCNMDWDRLKAKDLLALFSSFVPKGGAVLSVKIFPSEFGKERRKVEETQGPPELKALPDDSENETEEDRVYKEKLRDYQFKRLKYFYAVVECDSVETAAKIYEECDGFEYESSCSVLDLRFVPDDVTFDEEPRDVATDVNLMAYTPKMFTSAAVASSKVQLTWDETDHERVTALNRKFTKQELLDLDFKAYLASSSEEDEDEEQEEAGGEEPIGEELEEKQKRKRSEEQMSKYRELLKSIQSKEKRQQGDMEMEISWVPGLKETTERLVKKKLEAKDQLTPWEEFLQKKKEKKKQKKNERKQGAEEELSDDELPPDVDLSDPFFSDELEASDMKKKQKKKKQEEEQITAEEEEERQKQKAQMALLMEDDDDEAKHKHFNYDKIVEQQNLSRRKRKKLLRKGEAPLEDDGFQVDVSDPRFQAVFTSHLFNLDPSHPGFRNTRATRSILEEKQRRRHRATEPGRQEGAEPGRQEGAEPGRQEGAEPGGRQEAAGTERDSDSKAAMDPSLSLLVKSIKSKTERFQARKKRRVT
ncbi:ESF1 homolog isoform X1 [Poecilia reticulata]|uniref:ESF1, nucleolar pre-rRNA processing protein, homolog (S. cerevisiae) n=1 Tax=Poecilia reticulata TaxID=8081 RepID=A0A3P9NA18_POERE|nr:PREDICTED: ESF1 homolog isoform X1 [Poecilia reticulata]